jgi:glutamate N-acetyltransferase/amino-acid N-acetyltransferase
MSVVAPKGFRASGMASGIKPDEIFDLALVVADDGPVVAAATFTTNLAAAAPVQVSRAHLGASGGHASAVILNSGCANAATGARGLNAAMATTKAVADALGVDDESVLVCSTGLIGPQLAIECITTGIAELVATLGSNVSDGDRAARAIMTTDTKQKQVRIDAEGFTVGGMSKGAGMIAPNMATMLCVLTTDASVAPEELSSALRAAVEHSFNELIVDGSTSTNDTVICLASGLAATPSLESLTDALTAACLSLAAQMAADAEGTTKVAAITVKGAANTADAVLAARNVAGSLLVKTSLFGADPYWGRIVSELGSSGADFDLTTVEVAYGDVVVFSGGDEVPHDRDALVTYLTNNEVEINCDLRIGDGVARVLTTDLGHSYIDENMRTS